MTETRIPLTLTLTELAAAANASGYPAAVVNTGGNVVALALTVHGAAALVSLDDGQTTGETWTVSLDGDTREQYGETDAGELPVTSDASQTIADAAQWVRHAVWGDTLYPDA
jgi:hypothetical protein